MSLRRLALKTIYPAFMAYSKDKMGFIKLNENKIPAPVPFHSLKMTTNAGKEIDLSSYKGKMVLLVNTASDCGYTNQYADLEKLYKTMGSKLVVLGFPANDFKEQEKGSDADIASFCQLNYGVTFPLAKKSSVVKPAPNAVFQWLSDKKLNGWNDRQPKWNFCKYLVDENGMLLAYFGPAVPPLDKAITGLL